MATLTAASTMIYGQMTTNTSVNVRPSIISNSNMPYGQMTTNTSVNVRPSIISNNTSIYATLTTTVDKFAVPFSSPVLKNGNWN